MIYIAYVFWCSAAIYTVRQYSADSGETLESLSSEGTCYKNNQRDGSTSDKGTKIANGECFKSTDFANTVVALLFC